MAPLSCGPFAKFHYGLFLIGIFLDVPLFLSCTMSYFTIIWNILFRKIHFQNVLYTTPCLFRNDINGQNAGCYVRWRMTSFYHFQVCFMTTFFFVLRVGTVYLIHFRHNLAPIQNLYSDLTSFKLWHNSMLQIMIDFSFETSKIIAYANVRFIVSSVFKAVMYPLPCRGVRLDIVLI